MTQYLTVEQLISVNSREIEYAGEGTSGVADQGGLESIVEQPKMVFFGREAYPTIWLKAAYIFQKITKKHVFFDGNKRTSWVSAMIFLKLNGYNVNLKAELIVDFVLEITVAPDSEEEMVKIASFLEANSERIR